MHVWRVRRPGPSGEDHSVLRPVHAAQALPNPYEYAQGPHHGWCGPWARSGTGKFDYRSPTDPEFEPFSIEADAGARLPPD